MSQRTPQKRSPSTIIETREHHGISITLKKITGLSVPYYVIDVLEPERNGSRSLRTMTTKNESMVYKVTASLVVQLLNETSFWNLKFSTI